MLFNKIIVSVTTGFALYSLLNYIYICNTDRYHQFVDFIPKATDCFSELYYCHFYSIVLIMYDYYYGANIDVLVSKLTAIHVVIVDYCYNIGILPPIPILNYQERLFSLIYLEYGLYCYCIIIM